MAQIEVAAYYFPQWHPDARNDKWHGKGWTEWELVKAARPRFEGHRQPIVPAWGMFDESNPIFAGREIELAATHGVTAFIYDYYYYEDGPFLAGALDHGFLGADNNDRLKFALMWANHNWKNWHPAPLGVEHALLAEGKISAAVYERMITLIVERYFLHPSYLRIEGCPYFSIFDLVTFVDSFGGVEGAREAMERMQLKAAAAGLPGVHFNMVMWCGPENSRWKLFGGVEKLALDMGFDSVTAYNYCDHYHLDGDTFPKGSYAKAAQANFAAWEKCVKMKVPYIPNVTMGWDASPRCCGTDHYEMRGYPWIPILEGNSPGAFRNGLEHARAFVGRAEVKVKMVTLNAWNEWTEGAYLLPDEVHGTAYLEMVKRVFTR